MRNISLLIIAPLMLMLAGCGGSSALGKDSPVQVRLEATGSTVAFATMHVIISPNSGSFGSVGAASDVQAQSWATQFSGAGFKELDFTTQSGQVPYFVYVQNGGVATDHVRLRIIMDGNEKFNQIIDIGGSTTTQEQNIFRNNVGGP